MLERFSNIRREEALPQVRLLERMADDFDGIEPESFDVVLLNSVVQYFPDIDYLLRVLEGAVQSAAPSGALFIGDVRSLPLLEAFHASVQLHQAPDTLSRAQLRTRVARQTTLGKQRWRLALELHVQDNGPGVPESIRDRIFYPLVSGRDGGSGLGLTLAQTFVQQHHGTIECESVPGNTDFKILIPLP